MRILQVVHGFPPDASGGTEVYVRNLAGALTASAQDQVAVFTRHSDRNTREFASRRWMDGPVEVFSVNNTFHQCESFESSYTNPAIEAIAASFLDDWRPDVVHLQHLTCLSTGIPRQAVARGVPVVMTLNDYWLLCHRGQLVDLDGRRCSGPWEGGCARCLPPGALATRGAFRSLRTLQSLPIPGVAAASAITARVWDAATPLDRIRAATVARLKHMRTAVEGVRFFLVPSETLAAAFAAFDLGEDRIIRCSQGISTASFEGNQRMASNRLRIGYVGGLLATKGAGVLIEALEYLPPARIVVDLLGTSAAYHGDRRFAETLERRLGHPAIRRLGSIPHHRMPAVLADLDVLVVPSIWIENAPFVIREAFAAGVPVIASNLGGMAEMVRDGVDGLLFPAGDSRALAATLRRLIDEPDLLPSLRTGILRPLSLDREAEWLRTIYLRAGAKPRSEPTQSRRSSKLVPERADDVSVVILNYQTPDQTYLAVRSLRSSFSVPGPIVVVDNGSNDGSAATLRRSLTDVHFIESADNLGFSGGCNLGIRTALQRGSRFVLLMNSDAVLAPDAIRHLRAAMEKDLNVGIAGPVLVSREEPDHISSAGISFSTRSGRMRHRASGRRVAALGPDPVRRVDAISGCVMLIRREVFEKAGFLDEEYFFSFEDIDFCLRARERGFEVVCVHDARAYHEGGRTIGRRSAKRVYFATRNHLRLAARTGGRAMRPLRLAVVAALNAAYVLVSPESPLAGGTAAFVRGVWHHLIGRYGAG